MLQEDVHDAGDPYVLGHPRDAGPEALEAAQLALAAAAYNRMGMEGERDHGEGGVTRSVDALPEDIRRQLNPYRLAKAVGA